MQIKNNFNLKIEPRGFTNNCCVCSVIHSYRQYLQIVPQPSSIMSSPPSERHTNAENASLSLT